MPNPAARLSAIVSTIGIMGGETIPKEEHLLILWTLPEPENEIAELRRRFPSLKITYIRVSRARPGSDAPADSLSREISDDIWLSATYLCAMAHLPPAHLLPRVASSLKFIQFTSSGVNHIYSQPAYTSSDIPLATVSGIHGPPISEWVALQILADSHQQRTMYRWQSERHWGSVLGQDDGGLLRDGVGRRVGILGYGSIGRQSARVLSSMGMKIVAFTASPRLTPESKRDNGYIVPGTQGDLEGDLPISWHSGLDKASLHEFLGADLDYLLIAIPLTPESTRLLGEEEFNILGKKNGYILNISRGAIIDQDSLISALKKPQADGGLRGAALDVTDPEPLPADHELWGLENVTITPHVSALNKRYWERSLEVLAENISRSKRGAPLVNVVDRSKGY